MLLLRLVDIGHSAAMLPVAAAITAHLIAGRASKSAMWWAGMFTAGLTVVALSKLLFLGWGIGIPILDFQAFSGHAFRATAVIPTFFFVVAHPISPSCGRKAVTLGITTSLVICWLLIYFKFHTISEVFVSAVLGSVVGIGFMRVAKQTYLPPVTAINTLFATFFLLVIVIINPSSLNHRLADVAHYLARKGNTHESNPPKTCLLGAVQTVEDMA